MKNKILAMTFASIYPHYIAKAEKKGRSRAEVNQIILWLTGYSQTQLEEQIEQQTDLEAFFANAPQLNPSRETITGTICGIRIENITDPAVKEVRYLDKLIDELAKGKEMEKILRH